MLLAIPLAWRQLVNEKLRMTVALAGVGFAVILIFMQLGFREALFDSAVRHHKALNYDLVLISPKTAYIVESKSFSQRRLYQALAIPGVEAVSAVYVQPGIWRNPENGSTRQIFVMGVDPSDQAFDLEGVRSQRAAIRYPDRVLFDAVSRPEYGPVAEALRRGDTVSTEVNNRQVEVAGLFELGTSFGIDGTVITSDLNFRRIFPDRSPGLIEMGLIQLQEGADPELVRDVVDAALADDVMVLTREGFVAREQSYWATSTPIGYVFTFGVIIGLVVGGIIVYQILFADVNDHLAEYATLKAMGYSNQYLFAVVLQEALILAVLGFVPGLLVCLGLYHVTAGATRLPLEMTTLRAVSVLALTVAMCGISGSIALRKIRSADPAEVF